MVTLSWVTDNEKYSRLKQAIIKESAKNKTRETRTTLIIRLDNKLYKGRETINSQVEVFQALMDIPNVNIFGSAAKQYIEPSYCEDLGDIDLILVGMNYEELIAKLEPFKFYTAYMDGKNHYPRYRILKSTKSGPSLHVLELDSEEDRDKFVGNLQLSIDRVYLSSNEIHSMIDMEILKKHLSRKLAYRCKITDESLFTKNMRGTKRSEWIEHQYFKKLELKGFKIL